jgi:hypothetical protein
MAMSGVLGRLPIEAVRECSPPETSLNPRSPIAPSAHPQRQLDRLAYILSSPVRAFGRGPRRQLQIAAARPFIGWGRGYFLGYSF